MHGADPRRRGCLRSMTANRPYRGPLPAEVALAELERCDGARYDALSVAALRELVATTLA